MSLLNSSSYRSLAALQLLYHTVTKFSDAGGIIILLTALSLYKLTARVGLTDGIHSIALVHWFWLT